MVVWNLAYSKYAIKDAIKLSAAGLKDKAQTLLDILEVDPLQNRPPEQTRMRHDRPIRQQNLH